MLNPRTVLPFRGPSPPPARFADMPSTVISAFDYDASARRLDVRFVSGRHYSYHDVPPHIATGMQEASSKGVFFNKYIRDHYRTTRRR